MDALLKEAVDKLPPELLRIIAVKYRRNIEIKPRLCPEAITQEPDPIHKQTVPKYIYDQYILCGYTFKLNQIDEYADIYIYKTDDENRSHYMTIYYYASKDLLDCRKYLHDKPFPIEVLVASLILFKRYGNKVSGNTQLRTIEKSLRESIFIKNGSIRDTLYKDPTLWNS